MVGSQKEGTFPSYQQTFDTDKKDSLFTRYLPSQLFSFYSFT